MPSVLVDKKHSRCTDVADDPCAIVQLHSQSEFIAISAPSLHETARSSHSVA